MRALVGSPFQCSYRWLALVGPPPSSPPLFSPHCSPAHLEGGVGRAVGGVEEELTAGHQRTEFASPLCHYSPCSLGQALFSAGFGVPAAKRRGCTGWCLRVSSSSPDWVSSSSPVIGPPSLRLQQFLSSSRWARPFCAHPPSFSLLHPSPSTGLSLLFLFLFGERVSGTPGELPEGRHREAGRSTPSPVGSRAADLQRQTLAGTAAWPLAGSSGCISPMTGLGQSPFR